MSALLIVELSQSIPENGVPVCLGQVLQYTCSTSPGSLAWLVGLDIHLFTSTSTVNLSVNVGEFVAVLTANNGTFLSSTLTNTMISLDYNGLIVECAGGASVQSIEIVVAGNH